MYKLTAIHRRKARTVAILAQLAALGWLLASCASPANSLPVADAGGDLTVFAGYSTSLDGSSSRDADGDSITYDWQLLGRPAGSGAEVSGSDTASPSFTADVPGQYVFALGVSDGKAWSASAGVVVSARPWFTEVAEEAGVYGGRPQNFRGPDDMVGKGAGPGASWGDYDNDGDPDLYVTADGPAMLYRNNGDGTFANVAQEAGVTAAGTIAATDGGAVADLPDGLGGDTAVAEATTGCNSYGSAWGDYDSDGYLDLYVVCHGPDEQITNMDHQATAPNYLYHNNGDGTFTEVAHEAGVDNIAHGLSASWVDFDRDGHLDLYVANWGVANMMANFGKADRNLLYRNNGDGTFTDVAEKAGVKGPEGPFDASYEVPDLLGALTFSGLWLDYDNDGDSDLVECSDIAASPLHRNNGDGTFTDVTKEVGLYLRGNCMGIDSADYDRDGWLDIAYSNYGPIRGDYLWHGDGDGTFTEVAARAGVSDPYVGWGLEFIDFDNDGLVDFYMINGLVGVSAEETGMDFLAAAMEPDFLYRNKGDGTFADVTALAGFGSDEIGRGSAAADYDNDGDLDVYVVHADRSNVLYRNDIGNLNNWLKLRFEGTTSNRGGVGVRVRVDTGEWSQIADVKTGNSYLAGNEPRLHFGLAQLETVKEITVTWPSGLSQSLTDVPVNQTITVKEADAGG